MNSTETVVWGDNIRVHFRERVASPSLAWYMRGVVGRSISLDDTRDICELAVALARGITEWLPTLKEPPMPVEKQVLQHDLWMLQAWASQIEKLINPADHPFGSEMRASGFGRRGPGKVRKAAMQFLSKFDSLISHYGWNTQASKSSWRSLAETSNATGSILYNGSKDALAEPPPRAIQSTVIAKLKNAADKLWREVVFALPKLLEPAHRKVLGTALSPLSTRMRVLFILHEHPEWTVRQIAKEADIAPGNVSRTPGFKEARKALRREGAAGKHKFAPNFYVDENGTKRASADACVTDEDPFEAADDDE